MSAVNKFVENATQTHEFNQACFSEVVKQLHVLDQAEQFYVMS
jgi:hypothetical protein